MIDFEKIPISTYLELVELMGKENAEAFIKEELYNYRALTNKILYLRFVKKIKKRPWILVVVIILIVLSILYYYLDMFLII